MVKGDIMIKQKTYKFFLFLLCFSFLILAFFSISGTTKNTQEYTLDDFYKFEKAVMALDDNESSKSEGLNSKSFNSANEEESPFYLKRLITVGELDSTYGAREVVDGYKNISFLCYDNEEQAEYAYSKLSQDKEIKVIVDQVITIADYSDIEYDYSSNPNWGYKAINAGGINDYLQTYGTSEDVVVAVLDSGVNTSHYMFEDRFIVENGQIVGYSYYQTTQTYSGYSFEDDHGHGSHVSGIITSSTPDNAKILPIKVLNSLGNGNFSYVILALERIQAVYSKYNICAINLSIGGESNVYTLSQLNSWFEDLREQQNILTVVAAGNDKLDTANYMPANSENVITVSALKQDGNGYVFDDDYSNFGQSVDIAAPGSMVVSAYRQNTQNYQLVYMSGTSMAAPHVSAAVALLCSDSKYWSGSSPSYTADEIEIRLYENTTDLGEPGKDIFYGYGMLDLKYFNVQNNQDVLSFKDGSGNVVSTENYTEFTGNFTLNVTSSDSGYQIFYTTDGTTPDKNSYEYISPLNITSSVTYKFIAIKIENGSTVASSIVYTVELFNPNDDVSDFFVINSSNVVIKYTGHFKNLVIPDTIDGISVKALGNYLFYQNNVESVSIPDSCQVINSYCFSNCENLNQVTFNNVYYIGAFAFENCVLLDSINLDSVTDLAPKDDDYDISGHVFDGCLNLKEIYLPYVENMGANNFENSQVESVYIGLSLSTVYGRSIDSGITVYGYKNSTAEDYCVTYGNTFVPLDEIEIAINLPSSKTVMQYSNDSLSISATGFRLSYQWYKTADTTSNGVALAGETESSLQLDTNNLEDNKYFVQINAWGGKSLYSNICSVSIQDTEGYVAQIYDGSSWQYYESLNDAVNDCIDGSVIVLIDDCYLTEPLSITSDISIVAINNASIYLTSLLKDESCLITVSGKLTLGSSETTYQGLNLTSLCIDGQNDSFATLFNLQNGSSLNIQANASVQNITLDSLIAESGTASFNMYGGTITNINKTGSGSLIDVSYTTLAGGTISNCTATNGNLIDASNGQLVISTISITNNSFVYLIASYYDGEITITGGGFGNNECKAILLYNVIDYESFNSFTNALNLYGGVSLGNHISSSTYYDVIISDRENGDILNCVRLSKGCQFTKYYIDNSKSSLNINIIDSLYSSLVLNIDFYDYTQYLDENHPIFTLNDSVTINTDHLQGEGYSFILSDDGKTIYLKDTILRHVYYVIDENNIVTQDYYYGDSIILPENPRLVGYNFLGWYCDQDYQTPFTLETMPASDVYVYAKWEIQTFIILATSNGNGSISPSGEVVVEYGQDKLFSFTASDGYHVSLIEIDGKALSDDELTAAAQNGYQFEDVTEAHSIYVEFEINSYAVNVTFSEYGNVSPNGTNLSYTHGQSETFTLTAGQGAYIKSITINGVQIDSEYLENIIKNGYFTLNITENYEIYVEFALNSYVLSASTNGYGSITPSGDSTITYGGEQTYLIIANTGYHLERVVIDGVEIDKNQLEEILNNGYSFVNITQNHTIYAEFSINSYTINASTNGNGQISPVGNSTFKYGDNTRYQITANKGYKIKNVFIDDAALFTDAIDDLKTYNYSFESICDNHEIYVEFEKIKFDITINIDGNGTITSSQDKTSAEYGDYRRFTINTNFDEYDVEVYVNDVLVETNNNQFIISNIENDLEIDVRFLKKPFASTTTGIIVLVSLGVIVGIAIISVPLTKAIKRRRMYRDIDRY